MNSYVHMQSDSKNLTVATYWTIWSEGEILKYEMKMITKQSFFIKPRLS